MARRTVPQSPMARGQLMLGWQPAADRSTGLKSEADGERLEPIWHSGEGHLVTIAPTGAGKGVSCIIPALLTWDGPAIVVDPKGENFAVTAERRRQLGQKVAVLDPFNVTETEQWDALNPLDLVAADSPSAPDDAAVIAKLLIQGRVSVRDPFWDERAESLIAGLVLYVAMTTRAPLRSLAEVRFLIEQNEAGLDATAKDMHRTGNTDVAAAANILQTRASNTRSGIMSSTSSHLSFLRAGPVQSSLAESTISLEDVQRGLPMTIYLVVPPDKLISHGKLLRLWLGVLMTTLARRRRQPLKPTLLILDEAAQLGPLDELRAAVTLMRGYGVKVWSFWQDLSQLMHTYPLDWRSIMNNCSVQQMFGAATPQASAEVETYLGGRLPRLAGLGQSEALLIERGETPRTVTRPNYLTDRMFRGLARSNPFYRGRPGAERGAVPGNTERSGTEDGEGGDNVIEFPRDRIR